MKYYDQAWSEDPRAALQNQAVGSMLGMNQARGEYAQAQQAQQGALGMYQDAAAGNGPSAAQAMHAQMADQNRARAVAMASQGRGGGLSSQRDALTAGLAADTQAQQQAAQLRAQEQQAAMQGYAGLGMQMGGQAQQQQAMQMQQQQGLLGMQFQDDAARREAAQRAREHRTQRNLGWTQYGTNVAGSVFGAVM